MKHTAIAQMWRKLVARPDILLLLALVVLARIIPHPWNVTPIGAIALFAGARLDPRWSWVVALVPLAIGDLLIGGYNPVTMLFVYLGIAGTALAGRFWLGRKLTMARGAGGVLSGSVWFFLASNFGVWAAGYYPQTWAGLIECYVMGLPFIVNTIAGDAFYASVIFGLFVWLQRSTKAPAAAA